MNYIKFSGLGLSWEHEYAKKFSNYLQETGFLTRILYLGEFAVVVYSHRSFTSNEANESFVALMNSEKSAVNME